MNISMQPLPRSVLILFLLFLVFTGLYFAKPFLVPLLLGGMFSMLWLPLARKFEIKGFNRGMAALGCVLILVFILAAIIALISWQVSELAKDLSGTRDFFQQTIQKLEGSISKHLGISKETQEKFIKEQQSGGSGEAGKAAAAILGTFMGILVDTLLVLVYMFLLLYARLHIKQFILKLVPQHQHQKTNSIIKDSTDVVQQYLSGLAKMIVVLWVMYGIGFSIVGVKNALFFAFLCGLLEIIPFVGNITGTGFAILASLSQGAGTNLVIGIVATYGIVQFLQTYILEPLVVGAGVKLNPLFTIIGIVIGELLWGIAGMVLAIPVLGMTRIICIHIDALKPYGFLIGEEKKKKGPGLVEKVKGWFK